MADKQKEAQKVGEPQQALGNTPKPEEKKKMSTGAKIAIGCGAILLLVLIILGALAIAGVSFFSKIVEEFDGPETVIEEVYVEDDEDLETAEEDDEFLFKKSTKQGLKGDLESSDMLTDKFPKDIPLSGGKITASSRDELAIIAELDVDATVEEAKQWYIEELKKEGWEISSQSENEPIENWLSVDISFESADGERRGDIKIEQTPYSPIPHIRIRELLY